jgi:chromatin segregation and condensation protein Rec8/ScpA/Scc1 (kleisin family)
MMATEQLNLLWFQLQAARLTPETLDLRALLDRVDTCVAQLPESLQLQVAGSAMLQVAQLLAFRAEVSIESWEHSYRDPVVSNGFFSDLVRQSMAVDLSDLIEPAPKRKRRIVPSFKVESSIVAPVDKSAVLEMVRQLESNCEITASSPHSEEEEKQKALAVAHDEDVSSWIGAIANYFFNTSVQSLPLVELAWQIQSPTTLEPERKMRLVKTWLAVLSGDFELEQREDFYSQTGVWVSLGAIAVSPSD